METEGILMEMITYGGLARTQYLKALTASRKRSWEEVSSLLDEADRNLNRAQKSQLHLIQNELSPDKTELNLLAVHALDHVMNAVTVKELVTELIADKREQDSGTNG